MQLMQHIMRRRKPAASNPVAAPQPARHRGRPSTGQRHEPVAGRMPSPFRPLPNRAASANGRGTETGDPEMEETARWEMVTAPLPSLEEGRAENLLFRFVFVPSLAQQPLVPKTSVKERSPGLKRRRVEDHASRKDYPPPLSPAGSSGLPKSIPPAHSWNQVRAVTLESPLQVVTCRAVTSLKPDSCNSSHTRRNHVNVTLHTQTLSPAITGPGLGQCVPPRCHTAGMLEVPLVSSLGAWLALPCPSRWLLRTISLGYAIQFAWYLPKFRGIRFTSVKDVNAPVLCAEITFLLANDAIEPVPPAVMRSGFYSPY